MVASCLFSLSFQTLSCMMAHDLDSVSHGPTGSVPVSLWQHQQHQPFSSAPETGELECGLHSPAQQLQSGSVEGAPVRSRAVTKSAVRKQKSHLRTTLLQLKASAHQGQHNCPKLLLQALTKEELGEMLSHGIGTE